MAVLALIIICIIILVTKNKEIERLTIENKKLKEKLKQYQLGEIKETKEVKSVSAKAENVVKTITAKPEQVVNKKPKMDDAEKKNITILATGAICIVLAAIVFLVSTWATIPNLLKTIVLVLLTVVFFVGSNIAEKKYKLPKASKVFYYIGMAYIPICLVSISIFKLFGEYLSYTGDGKHIYFVLSAILTAVVYYKNRKDRVLLIGSILSQYLAIVSFSLILSNDIVLVGINLLLYNILLMLLTKDEIFKFAYKVLPWIASVILLTNIYDVTLSLVFMQLALAANYLILELKKMHKINAYMFNIVLVTSVVSIFNLLENTLTETALHFGVLISILIVHVAQRLLLSYKNNKNLIDASTQVTGAALSLLYIVNMFEDVIPLYIISALIFTVFTYYYSECKDGIKNVVEVILSLSFIVTGLSVLTSIEANFHSYVLFAFVTYLINELLKEKMPTLYVKSNIISHLYLLITILTTSIENGFNENAIYLLALVATYIYSYKTSKNEIFKYAVYITANFALYGMLTILDYTVNPMYYVPMITTLAFTFDELRSKKKNDIAATIYLTLSQLVSFGLLYNMEVATNPNLPTIIALGSGAIITWLTKSKENKIPHFAAITCMLIGITDNNFSEGLRNVLVVASVAGLTVASIKQKAWSIYTIASGIYLVGATTIVESVYLLEILFLAWSVVHLLFVDKEYQQDIFKGLAYIAALLLYNTMIVDLKLDEYVLFAMMGYLLATIAAFRTIISRYMKDVNNLTILECIAYGIVYLVSLGMYKDELDGIFFVALLVAIIMISYIKKYNALFMATSAAVLVNIFLLTREFWFSIPWWLYLLLAGVALIMFAVNNEANKNGENKGITAKKIMQFIQEKVDEVDEEE